MTKCLEEKHFKFLLSKEWLSNDKIINEIEKTGKSTTKIILCFECSQTRLSQNEFKMYSGLLNQNL